MPEVSGIFPQLVLHPYIAKKAKLVPTRLPKIMFDPSLYALNYIITLLSIKTNLTAGKSVETSSLPGEVKQRRPFSRPFSR